MQPGKAIITHRGLTWQLGGLGLAALICFAIIADLAQRFVPRTGHEQRPILAVLGWFAAAHIIYLFALVLIARRLSAIGRQPVADGRGPLWVILGFALAFRVILLPSNPIQEVDIYRYLWDGQVARAGVNPYDYSPAQVDAGLVPPETGERLREVFQHDAARDSFVEIEHRNVPTVYPPASQVTFLLAALLTPADATVQGHLVVMKLLFVAFDVGTILLLIALLRTVGKSPWWCLAYAWCPLTIKEFANSGHLDAQAIFFTTLALLLLLRGQRYFGALAWSLAILSKWYPLILLPLIVRQLWILSGQRATGFSPAGPKARRSLATIAPLLLAFGVVAAAQFAVWPAAVPADADAQQLLRAPHDSPLKGLRAFLTEWGMNDLVFHWLWRGVKAIWSADAQWAFVNWARDWWPPQMTGNQGPISPSFVLTYLLVGVLVGVFAIWWSSKRWPSADALLVGTFYVLMLFFLLNPTCNPWYLLWAVPLLPWAKERVWYLLPALVLQYYLRFWFEYHYPPPSPDAPSPSPPTIGGLEGQDFFDQVWLWIEWLPFLLLLAGELVWRWWKRRPASAA